MKNKCYVGGTPNGIGQRDYDRLGCGVYRSQDGLLIALVEPTDAHMYQAYRDGAWLILFERDKQRLVQRAGRLQQPHVGELIELAQLDCKELTTWHRAGGDFARRSWTHWYDNELLPDLAAIAAALDAAWTCRATRAIRDLFRRDGREHVDGERIPVWMRRGWTSAQPLSLLEEIYAEEL